jgi:uncharacterized FAD-dependent dehydrogenase
MKIYDIVIIGAGPAGAAAAKLAAENGLSVLILERGKDLVRRRDLISGWFGKGIFDIDRFELEDPLLRNPRAVRESFRTIKNLSPTDIKVIRPRGNRRTHCRLPPKLGMSIAAFYFDSIKNKADIAFNTEALKIEKDDDFIIHTTRHIFKGRKCIVATGKNSIDWIRFLCSSFGIEPAPNSVKVGVRVEVPTFRVREAVEDKGDIKMKDGYVSADDARLNSFVGEWEDSNILSAFGHCLPNKKSSRTNFMVGVEATEGTKEVIRNIKIINVLANDRIRCERVYDFMEGRSVLKHMKSFDQLKHAFESLEKIFPSITSYATMYVPEVRLAGAFPVSLNMKTEIDGLYGAGECTSKVSTMIGAMASGLVAIRTIIKEK